MVFSVSRCTFSVLCCKSVNWSFQVTLGRSLLHPSCIGRIIVIIFYSVRALLPWGSFFRPPPPAHPHIQYVCCSPPPYSPYLFLPPADLITNPPPVSHRPCREFSNSVLTRIYTVRCFFIPLLYIAMFYLQCYK